MKLYLIGSLRNKAIPELAARLRSAVPDVEVFDDWFAAGPEADDWWKEYEQAKGLTYQQALKGHAARHVFEFDKHHLDTSSHVLLVLPAGKSGHMEAMYAKYGAGKHTAILLDPEDVRWDVMYQFIPDIHYTEEDVLNWLEKTNAEGVAVPEENRQASGGFPAGRRPITQRVSDSRGVLGLLPECIGGGVPAKLSGYPAASSRRTNALGPRQVDETSRQDHAALDRRRKER